MSSSTSTGSSTTTAPTSDLIRVAVLALCGAGLLIGLFGKVVELTAEADPVAVRMDESTRVILDGHRILLAGDLSPGTPLAEAESACRDDLDAAAVSGAQLTARTLVFDVDGTFACISDQRTTTVRSVKLRVVEMALPGGDDDVVHDIELARTQSRSALLLKNAYGLIFTLCLGVLTTYWFERIVDK